MRNLILIDQNKLCNEISYKENIKGRFTRTTCKNHIDKAFCTKLVRYMCSNMFKTKKCDPIQILSK